VSVKKVFFLFSKISIANGSRMNKISKGNKLGQQKKEIALEILDFLLFFKEKKNFKFKKGFLN
jgi:hypothetical protein